MDSPAFASLAHIQILLIPAGNISKQSFEKWASIIKSFEHIRLDEIPSETREDRNRFIAAPLSTGHIHITYPSHPPPSWHSILSLFRPSHFPLGVIGIADCSNDASLNSILADFRVAVTEYFPHNSAYPLASKCYAFEEGEDTPHINLGSNSPDLVVIPGVMGHKKVYIGTLISELCADILGELSLLASALENSSGILNAKLFPTLSQLSNDEDEANRSYSSGNLLGQHSSARNSADLSLHPTNGVRPLPKRSSTIMAITQPKSSLSPPSSVAKKRMSTPGSLTASGRLYKILADLYLLAGRTADAVQWYMEAMPLLKGPQDTIWHASAIEGMCLAEVLDAWSTGESVQPSTGTIKQPWSDISDRLGQAVASYSRATPSVSPIAPSPSSAPAFTLNDELAALSYLYTDAVLRHSNLLFSVWSAKGWGRLTFEFLLRGGRSPSFDSIPTESQLLRMTTITTITRTSISNALAQAHGPYLLHLPPSDRLKVLNAMAALYSCLGYKRKEAYILREVLAVIMDLIVTSREDMAFYGASSGMTRSASSGQGQAGLGIAGLESMTTSGVSLPETGKGGSAVGSVAIRQGVNEDGNASVLKLVRYVCDVYGINLEMVEVAETGKGEDETGEAAMLDADEDESDVNQPFGWPELQVGVVREAVAIAEALPDYPAVAQFTLSTLRALRPHLTAQEQLQLYTTSAKALATSRRRGDDRRVAYWSGRPILSIEITPLAPVKVPIEHPMSHLQPQTSSSEVALGPRKNPFIYDPRKKRASATQTVVVQNEPLDFVLALYNPFAFDLELQSLSLSTSGVAFNSPSTTVTISAESFKIVHLPGTATEPGTLSIRGVKAQLSGGTFREFLLPLSVDDEDRVTNRKKAIRDSQIGRTKFSGLEARENERAKRSTGLETSKSSRDWKPEFLSCKVVEEQPYLRIRRTTLTQGAVMLYDGERFVIRLTLENISELPIDFVKLTFEDSTSTLAQQILLDPELSTAEAYELEYDITNRPVFTWDAAGQDISISPGQKSTASITCLGKVGCSSGTVQVSYAYTRPALDKGAEVFYTRQLFYPIQVTVYHTLECLGLDIVPYWREGDEGTVPLPEWCSEEDLKRRDLLNIYKNDDGAHEWCLLTVDVRNMYAIPFEVTFDRQQEGVPTASTTRLVSPGSTSRIILPLRRVMLPPDKTSSPIQSLTSRQFVVEKEKLTSSDEQVRRELFWYREYLFESVKAKWREPGTTRQGDITLRSQRLTLPMLEALRIPRCRVELSLVGENESRIIQRIGGKYVIPPQEFAHLRAKITNTSQVTQSLKLSYFPLPLTLMEPVLFDGAISRISVGKLDPQETREFGLGVCFVDEGRFEFKGEIEVDGEEGFMSGVEARICILVRE
ncbi:hypothetical protein FRC02_006960 [Tulasnella sp. 418]|nr:hypothetical protein FRC02_006960 [Tulasnella sp. 418]